MSKARVSVVIPAYNAEKTVSETIQSVINQTINEWEIIVVDDCSTDGTMKLVERIATKDDRIRIITRENNGGDAAARNTGIIYALSDWIIFLDADDLLMPQYIEKMFEVINKFNNAECIHCGWYRMGLNRQVDYYNRCYREDSLFPEFARKNAFSTVSACMVKKIIAERVNGFDTGFKICADWDFWQKIARTGATFKAIHDPLLYYRMTVNSLTSNIITTAIEGISVIERGHSYDIRIPFAYPKFLNGMPKEELSSAKLNWILWPCAYLIGRGEDPYLVLKMVNSCEDPYMDADYVAGVFHDTIMAAEGRDSKSWNNYWDVYHDKIFNFLSVLENQSCTYDLAKNTYSKLKARIFKE